MAHGRGQTKHGTMRDASSTAPISNALPRRNALKRVCDVYRKLTRSGLPSEAMRASLVASILSQLTYPQFCRQCL
jgi:hypothetical protein